MDKILTPDKEHYEYTIYKNDIMINDLNRALEVVVKFIKKRKLILVGGMAIDYALRLKGSQLYADESVPDYDFLSTDFIKDSRDLGEELCKMGLENISIINAMHINTIKVRVSYVTVADITYNPPFIFNSIPTLNYQGMRFIHPNYQKIDMHLSLSHPLNYPPLENIYFRAKKDMCRYQLLDEHYPMTLDNIPSTLKKESYKIPKMDTKLLIPHLVGQCIGDITAYYIYKDLFKNKTVKYSKDYIKTRGKYYIYSNDPTTLIKNIKDDKNIKVNKSDKYAPILDRIPERYELDTSVGIIIIYNNHNNKVACHSIIIGNIKTNVVNPQRILLSLLYMHHGKLALGSSKNIGASKMYYIMYVKMKTMIDESQNISDITELFVPSVKSYGDVSLSHSVELLLQNIDNTLNGVTVQYRPKNIYPIKTNDSATSCKPLKDKSSTFDLRTAEYYVIDGRTLESE